MRKKIITNNYIPAVAYKSLLLEGMQNSGVGQYKNCQNLNIGLHEELIAVVLSQTKYVIILQKVFKIQSLAKR